jgi:hypothetical protein
LPHVLGVFLAPAPRSLLHITSHSSEGRVSR